MTNAIRRNPLPPALASRTAVCYTYSWKMKVPNKAHLGADFSPSSCCLAEGGMFFKTYPMLILGKKIATD